MDAASETGNMRRSSTFLTRHLYLEYTFLCDADAPDFCEKKITDLE